MILLPPFKFFALQNFPFIEMDFDALTEVQLMYKIAEYLKKVACRTNENTKDIQKLIEWIQTLDLTDEVNQKLNEMAEDGTLAELINQEIFNELNQIVQQNNLLLNDTCKIAFPYRGLNAGDCAFIQVANKNILIDVGTTGSLITWLQNKNVTKIDYIIISHYHNDHVGGNNAEGLIQLLNSNIDCSNAIVYLPHKGIDWNQIIDVNKQFLQQVETTIKSTLTAKNIQYVEPDNNQLLVLNELCSIRFMNIGANYYINYYGLTSNEYNNFSMVCELTHNNRHALFTGDIIEQAEQLLVPNINEPNILKAPHHDLEPNSNEQFLLKMTPEVMIFMENQNINNGLISTLSQAVQKNGGKIYDSNVSQNVTILLKNDNIMVQSDNGTYTIQTTDLLNCSGKHLSPNTNLNDLKEIGNFFTNNYQETATLVNLPMHLQYDYYEQSEDIGRCRVINTCLNSDPNIINQLLILGGQIWLRSFNLESWSYWKNISNDGLFSDTDKMLNMNTDLNNVRNPRKIFNINK